MQAEVQSTLIRKRQTAKTYYDRHNEPLPDLTTGQPVRVKCHPQIPNSNWESGTVIGKEAPRSYGVQVNGIVYRRNRIHICQPTTVPTSVPAVLQHASMPQPAETKNLQAKPGSQRPPTHEKQLRRSSRVVKLPTRLRDYTLIVIRDYQPASKILNPTHTTKNNKHERTKTRPSKDTHTPTTTHILHNLVHV